MRVVSAAAARGQVLAQRDLVLLPGKMGSHSEVHIPSRPGMEEG